VVFLSVGRWVLVTVEVAVGTLASDFEPKMVWQLTEFATAEVIRSGTMAMISNMFFMMNGGARIVKDEKEERNQIKNQRETTRRAHVYNLR